MAAPRRAQKRPKPQKRTAARAAQIEHVRGRVRSIMQRVSGRYMALYDSAQTTDENLKHWGQADNLGPKLANRWEIRQVLRRRARYERDNNSYCLGMVNTLVTDVIGTGPRLQLLTDDLDEQNREIEQEFAVWADAIDLAGKLRLMDAAAVIDGESFALLITNRQLLKSLPVSLDLRVIEADHVTSEFLGFQQGVVPLTTIDGIDFDESGNPTRYRILRTHPGDGWYTSLEADWVPADQVLHWYRPTRAGQVRGIPEVTPALPLYAQLRRYTLAVLMAAEIAAELAAFISTELPIDGADPIEPMELLEIVRGQITTLPAGWKVQQLNPTQPATTYKEFVDQIIREIARCLEMPFGVAAGDSSAYNYASGRLDVQGYVRKIKVRRTSLASRVLNRVFRAWADEASTTPYYAGLFDGLPPIAQWRYEFFWDGFEHVDPLKEAGANKIKLDSGQTNLAKIWGDRGEDWEAGVRQRAKEKALQAELGVDDTTSFPGGLPADQSADPNAPTVPAAKAGDPTLQALIMAELVGGGAA